MGLGSNPGIACRGSMPAAAGGGTACSTCVKVHSLTCPWSPATVSLPSNAFDDLCDVVLLTSCQSCRCRSQPARCRRGHQCRCDAHALQAGEPRLATRASTKTPTVRPRPGCQAGSTEAGAASTRAFTKDPSVRPRAGCQGGGTEAGPASTRAFTKNPFVRPRPGCQGGSTEAGPAWPE